MSYTNAQGATFTTPYSAACPHCGMIHQMTCPRIKSIEYTENGRIKRIEFHEPNSGAVFGTQKFAGLPEKYQPTGIGDS